MSAPPSPKSCSSSSSSPDFALLKIWEEQLTDDYLADAIASLEIELRRVKRANVLLKAKNRHLNNEIDELRVAFQQNQQIFDEVLALRPTFVCPPPEILQHIFLYTIPPTFLLDPSMSLGPGSTWCRSLRQMKSLVLVNKSWYQAGIHHLYENVSLRRVHQIPAFCKALENLSNGYNLGLFVKKVALYAYIPEEFSEFQHYLVRIFSLCPRLHTFGYSSPIKLSKRYQIPRLPQSITTLEFSRAAVRYSMFIRILLEVKQGLKSLTVHSSNILFDNTTITFPQLEYLFCSASPKFGHCSLLLADWEMPALEYLIVKITGNPVNWPDKITIAGFTAFCRSHGSKLKYLHIHPEYRWSAGYFIDIQSILDACPVLEHLVLHPRTSIPISHPTVKWVDVWNPHIQREYTEHWQNLRLCLNKNTFPQLCGVRTLASSLANFFELPLSIPPDLLLSTEEAREYKFLGMHIRFNSSSIDIVEPEWSTSADKYDTCEEGNTVISDPDYEYASISDTSDTSEDSDFGEDELLDELHQEWYEE